jgi:hypothetical protein
MMKYSHRRLLPHYAFILPPSTKKQANFLYEVNTHTRKFLSFIILIVQSNGEILHLLGEVKTTLTAYSRSLRTFPLPLSALRTVTSFPLSLSLRCYPSSTAYFYHPILKHGSFLIMPKRSFK